MIISVDVGSGEVGLVDPASFSEFHVSAAGDPSVGVDGVVAALGADACPADREGHVWVRMEAVRRLAGGDADWRAGFDGMCGYAAGQGWVDATGECLAAHVVWQEAS